MNPEPNKAIFKLAVWITVTAGILMFVLETDTPAFWINAVSLVVGLLLVGVIILITRMISGIDGE